MARGRQRHAVGGLLCLAALVSPPAHAADPPPQSEGSVKLACAQSYESAQRLRKDGALRDAREAALACAQDACPAVLSNDCSAWLDELDAAIPTHVFELRSTRGVALSGAEISVDGSPFEANTGAPRALDPGPHKVVFRSAGGEEVEQTFQSTAGQRNALVTATLDDGEAGAQVRAPGGATSVPTVTWVLGGVGIVGLGVFGALAISGSTQESSLKGECTSSAPCSRDRGDAVKSTYLGADIALGVGLAALAAGVTWWLVAPRKESAPAVALQVQPRHSGGTMSLAGTF